MKAVKAAAPPRSTAQPPPARRLGRFVLDRLLGKGAQASVWLAHDPHLDREVALKLLGRPADTGEVGEWLQEARAVSRLSHPSVVPVFEAGIHEGQACLVFEYVDGQTLSELCRQTPRWSAAQAVDSMIAIGEALAAAHALGIVHRDLKPSNVLVGKDGRPRVMDFGIAARVSAGGDGRIVGTPGWISPEAARGEPPTPAMDVFAAGLMLAQLLCGRALLQPCGIAESLARIRHAGVPAAPHAPQVRLPGPGRVGGAHPAPGHAPRPRAWPACRRDPARRGADQQAAAHGQQRALHGHAGGGTISTVSRAVALIGFAGVSNMALSLVLLEHMQNKAARGADEGGVPAGADGRHLAGELAPWRARAKRSSSARCSRTWAGC
jgi:predicted Ser/Thr protein kinase